MLAQAGLSLAFDDLGVEGGIWTPASGLGDFWLNDWRLSMLRLRKSPFNIRAARN